MEKEQSDVKTDVKAEVKTDVKTEVKKTTKKVVKKTADKTAETLMVSFTNNSVSGHEILRANGTVVAIAGHAKDVAIESTKEELVALQSELATKPWIEIHLVEAE